MINLKTYFEEQLSQHVAIAIKGFYRRASIIPNGWKKRIGAVHELFTNTVDNNVQIQGLAWRMTGYLRNVIENGRCT
jgi:hypothetical protein